MVCGEANQAAGRLPYLLAGIDEINNGFHGLHMPTPTDLPATVVWQR